MLLLVRVVVVIGFSAPVAPRRKGLALRLAAGRSLSSLDSRSGTCDEWGA